MEIEDVDHYGLKTLGEEVGAATIRLLTKAGYKDIRDLAAAKTEELQEVQGIGEKVANKVLAVARAKIPKFGALKTVRELYEMETEETHLSTGCQAIDRILGGGFTTGSLNQIVAAFGQGKTQLCFQMAIQASLPVEDGGMSKGTVWIDTEGSFKARRIDQMARARGLDPDPIFDNVHVGRAYNSEHQITLVKEALNRIEELNVGLIIIDSLIAHFRAEYIGRGTLAVVGSSISLF